MIRCGECGSKNIKVVPIKEVNINGENKTLSTPMPLRQCQECKNVIFSNVDIHRLDKEFKKDE